MKRFVILSVVLLGVLAASVAVAAPKPAAKPAETRGAVLQAPAAAAPIDSMALLERDVARDSTKFDKLYQLGIMYLDHERMLEALRVFGKADQIHPNNVKVLVNMGVASDAIGHPEEAQGFYTRALALAPQDSIAACRMASSKYAQGKYDDAMQALRGIIAKQPRAYCAYFTMGVAFADAGIYRDAIRMWQKVVEMAPDSPEAVSAKESIEVLEKFLSGK